MRHVSLTCACLLMAAPGLARPSDYEGISVRPVVVKVVREEAEVFEQVSGASRSLGPVRRGQQYVLLRQDGADGDRVRIRYSDQIGWIDRRALQRFDDAEVNVVLALPFLIVRSAPGGAAVGKLENGSYVAPIATQGEWKKINYAGREAWIQAGFLGLPDRDHVDQSAVPSTVASGEQPQPQPQQQPQQQPAGGQQQPSGGQQQPSGGQQQPVSNQQPASSQQPLANGQNNSLDPLAQPGQVSNPDVSGLPRSRRGFVQLPASGTGFSAYSSPARRWGTPKMIYGIMRAGKQWATLPRQQGRAVRSPVLGIGEISLQEGGPISGHVSHQKGVDTDVRLARNDGQNAPTSMKPGSPTRGAYSQQFTAEAVNLFSQIPATLILLNDRDVPKTTWDRKGNHYDHFHVRIAEGN